MQNDKLTLKNSDDFISDSVDAFMAGDRRLADHYLHQAIEEKFINHFSECLKDAYPEEA